MRSCASLIFCSADLVPSCIISLASLTAPLTTFSTSFCPRSFVISCIGGTTFFSAALAPELNASLISVTISLITFQQLHISYQNNLNMLPLSPFGDFGISHHLYPS
jgi:hypothetical protein